ncbi:MAG TPA: S8 family serine peptidase [Gemmatimonadales bacterium]
MNRRLILCIAAALTVGACSDQQEPTSESQNPGSDFASASSTVGINVVLKGRATAAQLAELSKYGIVRKQFPQINGLTLAGKAGNLASIRRLRFVKGAAIDKFIDIPPNTDLVNVTDFTSGFSSWDQDAIDVTIQPLSSARDVAQTGRGVFVGILDTGLLNTWPQYFPTERIATQYATSFVGGGAADRGNVRQPAGDQWQHDVCAHGTHVASTILGYQVSPTLRIQGTAPQATVIPVMLHSQGSANTPNSCGFFSSVAAAGLIYFGDLKARLGGAPLVVNNSWGGSEDPLTTAAVNYALGKGVLLVFSAGNAGENGMGFPGALPQVISAAATGFIKEWTACGGTGSEGSWWLLCDVPEPTNPADFYITDFSSREHTGQDLDVAAPGSWVVGPFQLQRGKTDFFFLGGTSMAAPHVTGTVALMLQKNQGLTQSQAESILESSAVPMGAGCRSVLPGPGAPAEQVCWGADATGEGLLDADAAVAATP